ncbi:integrase, catalytic region, zinc finger, CCHC-type containing protein [Tanacetum coccineum]
MEENRNIDREIALEKKIKQLDNIIFKRGQSAQTVHMMTKSKICYDHSTKQAIGFEKPFYLKKVRESKPKLYDGNVILKMDTVVIPDSDETLMLCEESRSKMLLKEQDPLVVKHRVNTKPINYAILNNDYNKRFVRQSDLYSEHAYWKATSVPALDPSHSSTTVNVEVPKELPKVSMVNTSLKKLKRYLTDFDLVVKERTTATAITEGTWGENERLLAQAIDHDIVKTVVNLSANEGCETVNECQKRLELKTELLDKKDVVDKETYDKLVRLSTSASGSQPSGNTRNDKIQQTPSSNSKNKVEAHPRNVKSSLNEKEITVQVNGSAVCARIPRNMIILIMITTTNEVPSRKPIVLESESPKPVVNLVYSRKPRKNKNTESLSKTKVVQIVLWTMGIIYIPVGQFCDSNLEVAFRQHTCFIRNLEGVDLLTGSRGDNLYTLSLGNMMASSPICLLSKASKTKSWLWHRRLSHLNFGAINHLCKT